MKVSKELLKGTTSTLILSVLEKEDMYGYLIVKSIENKSEDVFSLNEGTLYPILHALEEEGFLEAYQEKYEGRVRKYYHITKKGLKKLKEAREEWEVFSGAVTRVITSQA